MKHLTLGVFAASTLIVGLAAATHAPGYGQSSEGQASDEQAGAEPEMMGGHGPGMGQGMGMGHGGGEGPGRGGGMGGGMGMRQGGHGQHGEGKPGHMARHRFAMMEGIPAPYTDMVNPFEPTPATLALGASLYADNCASCHGPTGKGDGPDAAFYDPAPADLAWLSERPMGQRDAFLYWTVAEGGMQFDSAMLPFRDALTEDEIWAVVTYLKAHLPQVDAEAVE